MQIFRIMCKGVLGNISYLRKKIKRSQPRFTRRLLQGERISNVGAAEGCDLCFHKKAAIF
jgi:hypothetical protein